MTKIYLIIGNCTETMCIPDLLCFNNRNDAEYRLNRVNEALKEYKEIYKDKWTKNTENLNFDKYIEKHYPHLRWVAVYDHLELYIQEMDLV